MSTISAGQSYQTYAPSRPSSERDRLASAIDGGVSDGSISRSDASALTSALDAIDSSLTAQRDGAASGSTTRLDPARKKERIDGLIADQVDGGTLTADQAVTLKGLFAAQGGRGRPDGVGDLSAMPPPNGGDGPIAASSGSRSDGGSATDLLAGFIQQLQATQTGSGYAASGAAGPAQASALLFDFKT